ncbi:MAG: LysR family transcriptional regulator [Eubacteriales bacterium]|nr:LysR family transcriptional regulator [Eubacteriales bacterium]
MTSRELLYVKTVADERSISKAARKLFMAQPSLSQSIQRIEESVGTPLFNRASSGLTLTYAGERYYHMAVQVLKIYENFELEISDINNLKTGRIHLGVTNHLGALTLSDVLPRFRQLCPFVEIFVSEENSARLERMLLSGELDFAIMHTPPEPSAQPLIYYDVMDRDPFIIAMAPDHPLMKKAVKKDGYPYPVLDLRHLKKERFLMLHKEQRIRQITDEVLAKAEIPNPDVALTLRNFETAQLLAAQGMGVMLVPAQYSLIGTGNHEPARLSIPESYGAFWDLCTASLKNSFLSKADQLFIRLLKEQFSPGSV